ncbi:glycosyltransferase family 2 protein, partial [Pseudomonas aeruginosa]|uniref:glycosyltransferase family 2 protein n=1 Tax=Pseudomonas aeruginosa TaxID=287 RepID=UPI003F1CA319
MIEEATSSKHSDTTDAPLVSVVAPCFNAEKYLEEALRSIYEQDYPNFEVIIVCGGVVLLARGSGWRRMAGSQT